MDEGKAYAFLAACGYEQRDPSLARKRHFARKRKIDDDDDAGDEGEEQVDEPEQQTTRRGQDGVSCYVP